jgi:hypothetical protein
MLTKHDEPDVVFFSGGGEHGGWENKGHCKHPTPAAVRFTVEGDTLKANVLWSGVDGGRCQAFVGLLYDRGRLWCNRQILDALTGVRVPGTEKPVYEAKERKLLFHFPYLVGDRVYGIHSFTGGDSECFVYEWNTGKLLAENVMTVPPPKSEEKKEQILQCMGRKDWGFFSYSGAYAIGNDCVYLRSPDELVCVGAK